MNRRKSHRMSLVLITCMATLASPALWAEPEGEEGEEAAMLAEYSETITLLDSLQIYNDQLDRLLRNQQKEIAQIEESIEAVTMTRRQIGPLTQRMILALEQFIELDLPFLLEQRREKIEELKFLIDRVDVATSEKFRRVVEAYQQEIDYGNTKEAYLDFIEIDGKNRQVDVLRWGRTVLAFQTPDGAITGVWDKEARSWLVLDDEFSGGVRDGLRIARKTMTDDLVRLPTPAPE
ncbi:MAG: DUF3450 domain-containing protein [Pseudomonadales bacterium]